MTTNPVLRESAAATRYRAVRDRTAAICAPLKTEDYVIQSMPDVSPTKWHLAHTTWFFETFVLREFDPVYQALDDRYAYLFNSYYVQAGDRFHRPHRGFLSRPTVEDVVAYRSYVDSAMERFLSVSDLSTRLLETVEIGLNHEQQHQELMVTDIKHVLSMNPLYPVYKGDLVPQSTPAGELTWASFEGGVVNIGHQGSGFFYDNEQPPHRHFLEPFELANRPVTNGEFLAFIEAGGYNNATLWLSQGWDLVHQEGWNHPLYWIRENDSWSEFSLGGRISLDLDAPLTHVSYFEADAFARFAGARLPTEFEWEHAAEGASRLGHFSDDLSFHPRLLPDDGGLRGMFGTNWEWTSSHYSPYPGYRPVDGALGEYNGKFMANQFVLRGGSCATPSDHVRLTYRNFFPSYARWQFAGVRLCRTPGTTQ